MNTGSELRDPNPFPNHDPDSFPGMMSRLRLSCDHGWIPGISVESATISQDLSINDPDPRTVSPRRPCSYSDMAVLTRTAYNTRELEESLASRGVPYTVHGGSSLFARPEVQAPLALLSLCANPQVK